MEFGLREYLLILGALLIVGLLADGIRRTLKHKREGLKLDLMAAPPASPEKSDVSPKRPVKRATAEELEPRVNTDPLFDSEDQSQLNLWAGEITAEAMKNQEPTESQAVSSDQPLLQGSDDTGSAQHADPLLDEASAVEPQSASPELASEVNWDRQEPAWDESVEASLAGIDPMMSEGQPTEALMETREPETAMPELSTNDAEESEAREAAHEKDMQILTEGPIDAPMKAATRETGLSSMMSRLLGRFAPRSDTNSESARDDSLDTVDQIPEAVEMPPEPAESVQEETLDDLVLVQLMPARAERFVDIDLHRAALRAGLRRTPRNWYQRYPLDQSETALYSLVNGVEPGVFLEDATGLDTPLLLIFTELSKQPDPVFAVNELISGARAIAREIGGDVFDTEGHPISKEWIDIARARAGQSRLMRS